MELSLINANLRCYAARCRVASQIFVELCSRDFGDFSYVLQYKTSLIFDYLYLFGTLLTPVCNDSSGSR